MGEQAPGDPRLAVIVAAPETGRISWTAILDAVRLQSGADVAAVTITQIREVVERLTIAGQWEIGDPDVLVVIHAGYDAPWPAHLPADLPVEILGRTRSDCPIRKPWGGSWISLNCFECCAPAKSAHRQRMAEG
ncbi:transposase [Streptomyces triculaminicus]|uniref:transposase n=1 Tax=Streptomyces triculaminicus TaxID=2816232 RepID=UPI0037A844E6